MIKLAVHCTTQKNLFVLVKFQWIWKIFKVTYKMNFYGRSLILEARIMDERYKCHSEANGVLIKYIHE